MELRPGQGQWCLAVVKFVEQVSSELVVRPLGKSQLHEVRISAAQIHAAPPRLSVEQVRQCVAALKGEVDYQLRVRNHDERDLFEGALVRYKDNAFGHVQRKHADGNYSVAIKKECKWFRGPRKLRQVHRTQLETADDPAFKLEALRYETHFPLGKDKRRLFHAHSDEAMQVYDFLEDKDVQDRYIVRLLDAGCDKLKFVLLLDEAALEELGVKLGHRKFILRLIRDFDADAFKDKRRSKKALREESAMRDVAACDGVGNERCSCRHFKNRFRPKD